MTLVANLIQSLPDAIHHPLQNILDLSLPLQNTDEFDYSGGHFVQALDKISQSGHLLYRRLQNILALQRVS